MKGVGCWVNPGPGVVGEVAQMTGLTPVALGIVTLLASLLWSGFTALVKISQENSWRIRSLV